MVPSPFQQDFNHCRMILLFEAEPYSNHYHQVAFTKEQFNRMSLALRAIMANGVTENDIFLRMMHETCVYLPSEIQEHYPEQ